MKKSVQFTMRMSPMERQALKQAAERLGQSEAVFVRRALEKVLTKDDAPKPDRASESVGEPGLGESASEKLDRVLCELAALRKATKEGAT